MTTDEAETYILLLLSDSNLPTGSFVASSGLESYTKHGFSNKQPDSTVNFLRDSLASYGHSALAFVSDAHQVVFKARSSKEEDTDAIIGNLIKLDDLYQSMTLNHVTRRASTAQGVALLTLYSKGFWPPANVNTWTPQFSTSSTSGPPNHIDKLIDRIKLKIRLGEVHGHLPICWGILTAALGLSLERSQYLHLFLHARSLLSAAVRLNDIGPYGAQQILLHFARPLVNAEVEKCKDMRTGMLHGSGDFDERATWPSNTWPLGEILAGRHDLQHSRIFNS